MSKTNYCWNPLTDSLIEESDGLGNVLCTYTNRPAPFGPLISENRSAVTSYYHFDAIGSTRLTTNSSQTIVDSFMFDAWGGSVSSTEPRPTPYHWCGQLGYQADSILSTTYVRARTFQLSLARWESIDPLTVSATPALNLRMYSYANNSPSTVHDPGGLQATTSSPLPRGTPFLFPWTMQMTVTPAPNVAALIPPPDPDVGIAWVYPPTAPRLPPGVQLWTTPLPVQPTLPARITPFDNLTDPSEVFNEWRRLAEEFPEGTTIPIFTPPVTHRYEPQRPFNAGESGLSGTWFVDWRYGRGRSIFVPTVGGMWEIDPTGRMTYTSLYGIQF